MADPRGFLTIKKQKPAERPVSERLHDWRELELPFAPRELAAQATRCMDCGIPFCHQGCPLGNLIPEWNGLVAAGRMAEAEAALEATNNFPEVTGRVCPAPCEASCVLALEQAPVSIKAIERAIAPSLRPRPPARHTGKRVAVIGSGPAGLAAAQELARAGHAVTVLEKADRAGGLLRYGIPDFKLEKELLDRRLAQLVAEGVSFRCGVDAGHDVDGQALLAEFHAVLLAVGAEAPRELTVPGRELPGVYPAMDYLMQQNRRVAGLSTGELTAHGKHVIVIGGGDTGSDCVGTAHRQGALSVTSLELAPRPPEQRAPGNAWPEWPRILRTSSSHDEGGVREFAVATTRLEGDGRVQRLVAERLPERTRLELPADLVLLAMGFVGTPELPLLAQLGLARSAQGTIPGPRTAVPRVYAAGDASRGQSLVVWAIAEGRRAAQAIDQDLRG